MHEPACPHRRAIILAALLALAVWYAVTVRLELADTRAALVAMQTRAATADTRVLVRAIDGDTLELDGGERVRIIGIDTPETWRRRGGGWERIDDADPRGVAAWEYVAGLEGRRVTLAYEEQRTDRYGRTLAHVRVWPDGPDIACELIRRRLADVTAWPPNTRRYGLHKSLAAATARAAEASTATPRPTTTPAPRTTQPDALRADAPRPAPRGEP